MSEMLRAGQRVRVVAADDSPGVMPGSLGVVAWVAPQEGGGELYYVRQDLPGPYELVALQRGQVEPLP